MKKKILVVIITFVLLYTTYTSCYASSVHSPSDYIKPGVSSNSTTDSYLTVNDVNSYNNGTVSYGDTNAQISGETPLNWVAEVLAYILSLIPSSINALLCIAIMPDTPRFRI